MLEPRPHSSMTRMQRQESGKKRRGGVLNEGLGEGCRGAEEKVGFKEEKRTFKWGGGLARCKSRGWGQMG